MNAIRRARGVALPAPPDRLRPRLTHTRPTAIAVIRLARNRASTIRGCPENATAVLTMTTGLTAGAERRKARAAAGTTPRDMRRPAIGTEPHSQPGSTTPAAAATGTASAGRSGSRRGSRSGGTNAAMAPLTRIPSTRNGMAWKAMATKIVVQLWTASRARIRPATWPSRTAPSTRTARSPRPGRALRTSTALATPAQYPPSADPRLRRAADGPTLDRAR